MESSNDPCGDIAVNGSNTTTSLRKKRGITMMKQLILGRANTVEKYVVEFDGKRPVGKYSDMMVSYIGYLARSKVRILIDDWRKVSSDTLEQIWQDILVYLI
nr:uncharacterized protein LOC109172248 isoform X1 [Ipomoea batatas]